MAISQKDKTKLLSQILYAQSQVAGVKKKISSKQSSNQAVDLSTVNSGSKPVVMAEREAPIAPSFPAFVTAENVDPYQGYIDSLSSGINTDKRNLSTLERRKYDEQVSSGVYDDLEALNDNKAKLSSLQDRQVEIPLERKQEYRDAGVVATKEDLRRSTTQDMENAALGAFALARNVQAKSNAIQANLAIIDQKFKFERDEAEFVIDEKVDLLKTIVKQQQSFLTAKNEKAAAEQEHLYELDKIGVQADYDMRRDAVKELAGSGLSFEEMSTMSTPDLVSRSFSYLPPVSKIDALKIEQAQASLKKINLEIGEAEQEKFDKQRAEITAAEKLTTAADTLLEGDKFNYVAGFFHGGLIPNAFSKDHKTAVAAVKTLLTNLTNESVVNLKARLGSAGGQITEAEWERFDKLSGELAALAKSDDNGNFTGYFDGYTNAGRVKELIQETSSIYYKNLILAEDKEFWTRNAKYIDANAENYSDIRDLFTTLKSQKKNSASSGMDRTSRIQDVLNQHTSFIKGEEGFSSKAYPDGAGYSVGYGFQTVGGVPVTANTTMSLSEAKQEFSTQLPTYMGWKKYFPDADLNTSIALTSFAYNLGNGIWEKDQTAMEILNDLKRGDKISAADKITMFNKGRLGEGQPLVKLDSLVARRQRERSLLLT